MDGHLRAGILVKGPRPGPKPLNTEAVEGFR